MPLKEVRKRGRPTQLDADRLSDQIVRAALASFFSVGFAATTIESVAQSCGTTRRSVFSRFPTKEDLLVAAFQLHRDEEWEALQARVEITSGDPIEDLRKALRALLAGAVSETWISMFRVTATEAVRVPELSDMTNRYSEFIERQFEKMILRAQDDGHFQRHSAAALGTAAVGIMLSNPLNRAMLGDPKFRDQHFLDLYFSQAWAVFLAAT